VKNSINHSAGHFVQGEVDGLVGGRGQSLVQRCLILVAAVEDGGDQTDLFGALENDRADLQLDQVVAVVDLSEVLDQHPRRLGTLLEGQ
jgi:hypothetical protein